MNKERIYYIKKNTLLKKQKKDVFDGDIKCLQISLDSPSYMVWYSAIIIMSIMWYYE